VAALRPQLLQEVGKVAGTRIVAGNFTAVQQAIGTLKTNLAAAAFLCEFVEEAKRSGLVASLIDKHRVVGLSVAPLA
jgi:polar amino acid transport system substrate-binding protein